MLVSPAFSRAGVALSDNGLGRPGLQGCDTKGAFAVSSDRLLERLFPMSEIVIVNGARTAFGAFGGGLATKSATDLAVEAGRGAIERSGVDKELIDSVIMGNVIQTSKDAIYLARHVALRNGLKESTPGHILNLLCGSGVSAVATAAMQIQAGMASVVLAGGTDALSMTPYSNWSNRWGGRMGHMELWDGLDIRDTYAKASMGETAENIQEKYKISREDQDEFALRSQTLAAQAMQSGRLREEIVPVEVESKKGKVVIEKDEHARAETTLEGLAKLKPVFRKGGSVTAGNACGIVDGAAALVVTSAATAEKLSLKPLVKVVSWAVTGVPPERSTARRDPPLLARSVHDDAGRHHPAPRGPPRRIVGDARRDAAFGDRRRPRAHLSRGHRRGDARPGTSGRAHREPKRPTPWRRQHRCSSHPYHRWRWPDRRSWCR